MVIATSILAYDIRRVDPTNLNVCKTNTGGSSASLGDLWLAPALVPPPTIGPT